MKHGYRFSALALLGLFAFSAFGHPNVERRVAKVANLVAASDTNTRPPRNPCTAHGYVCRPISPGYSCSDIGGHPVPYKCGGLGASCCDR